MSIPIGPALPRTDRRLARHRRVAALRPPARSFDDGATELVRVIEFVWMVGGGFQPVLMVERQLLS